MVYYSVVQAQHTPYSLVWEPIRYKKDENIPTPTCRNTPGVSVWTIPPGPASPTVAHARTAAGRACGGDSRPQG
eukprot:5014274-Pyramimonas_sp.AAC.1